MTKEELIRTRGEFTWCWSQDFFIETPLGNFHWKDPDYQGDNTIRPFYGTLADFCKMLHVDFGRAKGKHLIGSYVGENFTLVD